MKLVHAPERAARLRVMVWWAQQLEAAERVAGLRETSPVPRSHLAARLRQFAALFDRERAWDVVAEGEELRRRTRACADALAEQGRRGGDTPLGKAT